MFGVLGLVRDRIFSLLAGRVVDRAGSYLFAQVLRRSELRPDLTSFDLEAARVVIHIALRIGTQRRCGSERFLLTVLAGLPNVEFLGKLLILDQIDDLEELAVQVDLD